VIDRFHHVLITPADYEASLAFYRDRLGWTATRSWGEGPARGTMLSGGGMKVILTASPIAGFPAGRPHLHLENHDIDKRFADLRDGVEAVIAPGPTPWGTRWFVVRDPDGNLIAFEEVHGRAR
jgi:catechol 2,3-dioxygenase-like lactoylglutathione lyase family enzyme